MPRLVTPLDKMMPPVEDPNVLVHAPATALLYSIGFTLLALFVFGYVKGRFTGTRPFRSAVQTALIGGVAAAAAFGLAKAISP